jgi:hypothetical protein
MKLTVPFVQLPGVIWIEHALENAVGAAATAALTVWGATKAQDITNVPWQLLAGAAALGAFASLLKALATLHVGNNGTASLNPHVIADKLRQLR